MEEGREEISVWKGWGRRSEGGVGNVRKMRDNREEQEK